MISLCMVVRNEAGLLAGCIDDIKNVVQEIVIVDQSSTDDSVNIAKGFTQNVYVRPSSGFREFDRQYSIDQASHPWILILEPSDRLDMKIKSNLTQLISSGYELFLFPRKETVNNSHYEPEEEDFQVRFFKKEVVTWPQIVNANPILHTDRVGKINDGFIYSPQIAKGGNKGLNMVKTLENRSPDQIHVDQDDMLEKGVEPFDIESYISKYEGSHLHMSDDEAKFRLLYELARS